MPKKDYPAIFPAGLHKISLADFHKKTVAAFPADPQRAQLYTKFKTWLDAVKALGIDGILWLDGSFVTQKTAPDDIDCILWTPQWIGSKQPSAADIQAVKSLFDKNIARSLYSLDLYIETPAAKDLIHRQAYWLGFFGFCHDRMTAKGFVEVTL